MNTALAAKIGGLALLAAGAFFAGGIIRSAVTENPQEVLSQAIFNLRDMEQYEYTGSIATEIQSSNPEQTDVPPGKFSLAANGAVDVKDKANQKFQTLLDVSFGLDKEKAISGKAEFRLVGDYSYLILRSAPIIGFFNLEPLENQWMRLETSAAKMQLLELAPTEISASSTEITTDQIERLRAVIVRNEIFNVSENLKNEILDGVSTHHYKVTLEKGKLIAALSEVNAILKEGQSKEDQKEMDMALEEFTAALKERGVQDRWPFEIWIGEKDNFIRKLLVIAPIDMSEYQITGNVTITTTFTNINVAPVIEAPADARDVEEVLGGLFNQE
jgi:hypothetical protein